MDYGRKIQFGFFLTPNAGDYAGCFRVAKLCDQLGLDLIGIQDHPYQRRFFDTWTLMSALVSQTQGIRFFPDVINLPLRPPAMLAKAAATLDLISGGRIELGIGTGAFWEGIKAMGGPNRTPSEAVTALEEAISILRLMWSGERGLKFEGKHYQLNGAHSGPVPTHPIGIWLGAYGPRMLALTGNKADGWVPSSSYASPQKLLDMQKQIDNAALEANRDPATIQRLYNVMGEINNSPSKEPFKGSKQQWIDELTDLVLDKGMDTFIIALPDPPEEKIRQFMGEIAPVVKDNVAKSRE